MCNKNSPPPSDSQPKHPMPSTKEPALITLTRRRIPRKRKFRSLSLQLSANPSDQRKKKNQSKQMKHQNEQQQQLNLFPLHPENLVEDKDENMQDENDVSLLFSSDAGATLNGLLEGDYSTTTTATATTRTTTTEEEDSFSPPPSMTCPVSDGGDNGSWLVRKAMRRREKERDESEERWVCYSEVTSYCNSTASGGGGAANAMDREPLSWLDEERRRGGDNTTAFGVLSLKLDYDGILNAWSDKGSLYVPAETPQTVPDLHNDAGNVQWDSCWGNGAAGNLWKVPENDGTNTKKMKEKVGDTLGQREASVLRYKEKRRSRLFSKRIRYEVRKLNAEKRPRMKGRFVKRD